jgi:5-methylcytosine-specific restriction protein A
MLSDLVRTYVRKCGTLNLLVPSDERGVSVSAQRVIERAGALGALLSGRSAGRLDDGDLLKSIDTVGELRRALDAVAAETSAEMSRRGLAIRLGERSVPDVVATRASVTLDEARAWCTVGEAIAPRQGLTGEMLPAECPVIAEAMAAGTLAIADALVVVRTLKRVAPFADAAQLLAAERLLVSQCPQLSRRDAARAARRLIDHFDPDGAEPREDLLCARSGVTVHRIADGMVRWVVDMHPEAAGFLTTAVDARTAPRRQPTFGPAQDADFDPAQSDSRTLPQRRLDALVDIARESLTHDSGLVAGTPVTMTVTMTLDALLSGLGTAEIAGVDEPISAATARRLASDAEIIPAVLGCASEPLDLGRSFRLYTTPQRRAMAVRDGGCAWPSCNAPPSWCEAAHLVSWLDGGPTDLDNGVLLCPFHHRRLDHDGWAFERRGAVLYLIPPAHVDATRAPRRAGRLPVAA